MLCHRVVLRCLSPSLSFSRSCRAALSFAAVFSPSAGVERVDDLEYDLGHLAAFDACHLSSAELLASPSLLDSYSRDSVQLLVNAVFSLPTQPLPTDPGLLATLPRATTRLPRAKPLPQPAQDTRWEAFAKRKGIEKKKRGRMEWDEQKQTYAPRFGYGRANDESENVIIEEKDSPGAQQQAAKRVRRGGAGGLADIGATPVTDPWTRLEEERKERRAKNDKQQKRNLQAAAGNRLPGTIDLAAAQPSKPEGRKRAAGSGATPPSKQQHVDLALSVAQQSTASLGKFDAARFKEPPRKRANGRPADESGDRRREKESSLAVLSRLLGKDTTEGAATLDVERAANVTKRSAEKRNRDGGGEAGGRGGGGGGGRGSSRGGGRGGRGGGSGRGRGARGGRTQRGGRGGTRS